MLAQDRVVGLSRSFLDVTSVSRGEPQYQCSNLVIPLGMIRREQLDAEIWKLAGGKRHQDNNASSSVRL